MKHGTNEPQRLRDEASTWTSDELASRLRELAPSLGKVAAGGALLAMAARRRGITRLALGAVGTAIAKPGIDAIVEAARTFSWRSSEPADETRFGERGERDRVDEASWESFPASDPPAY